MPQLRLDVGQPDQSASFEEVARRRAQLAQLRQERQDRWNWQPDHAQEAAAIHTGHLVLTAPAGSGKTRVIELRVKHLLNQGVYPSEIHIISFTRKAVGELRQRLQNSLIEGAEGVTVATFDAYARNIVLGGDAHVVYAEEHHKRLRSLVKDPANGLTQLQKMTARPDVVQRILGLGDNWLLSGGRGWTERNWHRLHQRRELDPQNLRDFIKREAPVAEEYRDIKENAGLVADALLATWASMAWNREMSSLDLMQNAALVLADPKMPTLTQPIHLMVDEMQDANEPQWKIVEGIKRRGATIMAVGDANQSIYRWRGARPEFFQEFRQAADVATFTLHRSYRTGPGIGHLAEYFRTDREPAHVEWLGQKSGRIHHVKIRSYAELAKAIGQRFRGEKPSETLVLSRANRTHEKAFLEFADLRSSEVSVRPLARMKKEVPGEEFIQRILDLADAKNQRALEALLDLVRGTGIKLTARILASNRAVELDLSAPLSLPSQKFPKEVARRIQSLWRIVQDVAATPMVHGKQESVEMHWDDIWDTAASRVRKCQLPDKEWWERFWHESRHDLEGEEIDAGDNAIHRVRIGSIHQAKGLEADIVVLLDVSDRAWTVGRSPTADAQTDIRRLAYVACTRAKEHLILALPDIPETGVGPTNYARTIAWTGFPHRVLEVSATTPSGLSQRLVRA